MHYQDLTQPIHPGMTVWPGDPQPKFDVSCTFEEGNCRATLMALTTHSGTHVDAFSHILPEGAPMDAIPLDRFFGTATVIDCTQVAPGAVLDVSILDTNLQAKTADFLLFHTGWDAKFASPENYAVGFPAIGVDLAQWLVDNQKKGVGVDCYSVDPTDSWEMPAHQILMAGGVVIYENLCHLGEIDAPLFQFQGLPLQLQGLDASPVRALALWEPHL